MTDKKIDISGARASRDKDSEQPSRFITVGGLVDETQVSLCIYGDDLVPDEVSKILGVDPTSAHRKGDRFGSPRSDVVGARRTGAWILKISGARHKEPEELTATLLGLVPEDEALWVKLAARYKIRLFYGLFIKEWNRGFGLSPELVARISRMRAKMDFDIYANLEDEEG